MLSFAFVFALSMSSVCASDQSDNADSLSLLQARAHYVGDEERDGNPNSQDSEHPRQTPVTSFTLEASGVVQDDGNMDSQGWECSTGFPTNLGFQSNGHVRLKGVHTTIEECETHVEGLGFEVTAMSFNTKFDGGQCDYWTTGNMDNPTTCCDYWTTCVKSSVATTTTTTTTTTTANSAVSAWDCSVEGFPTNLGFNSNGHVRLKGVHTTIEECEAHVDNLGFEVTAMSFNSQYDGGQCDYWTMGNMDNPTTCCNYWTTCVKGHAGDAYAEPTHTTTSTLTTTTTTVVSLEGLDDAEKEQEIDDEQEDFHECAKWCYSKKHKNKPWVGKKCEWFACSTCDECPAPTTSPAPTTTTTTTTAAASAWECSVEGFPTNLGFNSNGHVRLKGVHTTIEECEAHVDNLGFEVTAMSFNSKFDGGQCDYWTQGNMDNPTTCCTYWTTCVKGR